ncbi:hypothetical protein MPER_04920, partial [Moniliophthora perniciosa FA553]
KFGKCFRRGLACLPRDVDKTDKQDDNAAARLFSAATLQFLAQKLEHGHYELLGLVVYLAVFGELCDAYQNRNLGHAERINIVLRTRYFVDMWQTIIDTLPGYTQTQYFVSREATDIIQFLIDGLISLIVIHRDYYPNVPLLPWLHSTEVCEHLFGLVRKLVADFALKDFFDSIPKVYIQVREFVLNSFRSETTDAMKARASGYHHTYANIQGLDIISLGYFPAKAEIERTARRAVEESDSLWAMLGVSPDAVVWVLRFSPKKVN